MLKNIFEAYFLLFSPQQFEGKKIGIAIIFVACVPYSSTGGAQEEQKQAEEKQQREEARKTRLVISLRTETSHVDK